MTTNELTTTDVWVPMIGDRVTYRPSWSRDTALVGTVVEMGQDGASLAIRRDDGSDAIDFLTGSSVSIYTDNTIRVACLAPGSRATHPTAGTVTVVEPRCIGVGDDAERGYQVTRHDGLDVPVLADRLTALPDAEAGAASDWTRIPRTADAALAMAATVRDVAIAAGRHGEQPLERALTELARWLPGGVLNVQGHSHADEMSLCTVYERAVCVALGWSPRIPDTSLAYLPDAWHTALTAFDNAHQDETLLDSITEWLGRYDDGGVVHTAIVGHMTDSLESHKWDSVATFIREVLDWTMPDGTREVQIELTRTVEIEVTQVVTVTMSRNEDVDDLERSTLADLSDHGIWRDGNGFEWAGVSYASDITDWEDVT